MCQKETSESFRFLAKEKTFKKKMKTKTTTFVKTYWSMSGSPFKSICLGLDCEKVVKNLHIIHKKTSALSVSFFNKFQAAGVF